MDDYKNSHMELLKKLEMTKTESKNVTLERINVEPGSAVEKRLYTSDWAESFMMRSHSFFITLWLFCFCNYIFLFIVYRHSWVTTTTT